MGEIRQIAFLTLLLALVMFGLTLWTFVSLTFVSNVRAVLPDLPVPTPTPCMRGQFGGPCYVPITCFRDGGFHYCVPQDYVVRWQLRRIYFSAPQELYRVLMRVSQ